MPLKGKFQLVDDAGILKGVDLSNTKAYYMAILKAVLGDKFVEKSDDIDLKPGAESTNENLLQYFWESEYNEEHSKDNKIRGKDVDLPKFEKKYLCGFIRATIKKKDKDGKDFYKHTPLKDFVNLLTETESKFYYKWVIKGENGQYMEAKGPPPGSATVLDQLLRVSVLTYNTWATNSKNPFKALRDISLAFVRQNIKARVVPIGFSSIAVYQSKSDKNVLYYPVYINPNAVPLYIAADDTANYKLGEEEGKGYQRQPNCKNLPFDQSAPTDNTVTMDNAIYDIKYRKWYYLREALIKNGKANARLQIKRTEKKYKELPDEKKDDEAIKAFIDSVAKENTKLLPPEYKAFYFAANNELKNFTTEIALGSSGGDGGAMRADNVSEVDYRWKTIAGQEDFGKLLGLSIGLQLENWLASDDPLPDGFFPTNWPFDKVPESLKIRNEGKVTGMESWIKYYKKFKDIPKRKNDPQPGAHLRPPRIINPGETPGKNQTKVTMSEANGIKPMDWIPYRLWRKNYSYLKDGPDEKSGEKLGAETASRDDAGTVMALALNQYEDWNAIRSSGDDGLVNRISDTKLPATLFAQYVVTKDDLAKKQWAADNGLAVKNVNKSSVLTQQEWCHLQGHGDGGPEELGNFISGSKHCNTEQLAIETGQRVLSHSTDKDITKEITQADPLKIRVTGYQMPNNGTFIKKDITLKKKKIDEYKEKLAGLSEPLKKDCKNLIDKLFIKTDPAKDDFRLASDFKEQYNAIASKIPSAKGKEKLALFQLQKELERDLFYYYPLGRWVRYKIYHKGKKLFDHIFDAQSLSFNYHEYLILRETVTRVIYENIGLGKVYKQKLLDKIALILPEEKVQTAIGKTIENLDEQTVQGKKYDGLFSTIKGDLDNLKKDLSEWEPAKDSEMDSGKKIVNDYEKKFSQLKNQLEPIKRSLEDLDKEPDMDERMDDADVMEGRKILKARRKSFSEKIDTCINLVDPTKLTADNLKNLKMELDKQDTNKLKRSASSVLDRDSPDFKKLRREEEKIQSFKKAKTSLDPPPAAPAKGNATAKDTTTEDATMDGTTPPPK